jgi:hypothetical protein
MKRCGVKAKVLAVAAGADIREIASAVTFDVRGDVTGRPPCAVVHFDVEADFDVSLL